MTFAAANELWWFLPLGGVIVALYLLRMRRKDIRVPATFLWPERTEEVRANAPIQKLKFNWLMVLQLLALAALILAFAQPQSVQRGLSGEVTVFVLDTGASMGATDVSPDRLTNAKRQIAEAITAGRPTDRVALIEAGSIPKVLSPLSSDKARLRSALDSATQTDAPPAMGEAMRLAAAICASETVARIVVLTDGDFAPVTDFAPGHATVLYQKVGTGDANLALTALGATDTDKGRSLYCGVRNFGHTAIPAIVNIYGDGRLIDSRRQVVEAGAQTGFTLPTSPDIRVFEAKLDAKDDLQADNYLADVTDAGSHLHVLLVSKGGDPFLEKALAIDPRVVLDKTDSLPKTEQGSGQSEYDVVVFDGVPEVQVKARSVLTFGDPGPATPALAVGHADSPTFTVSEDVPLTAGVDLRSTYIKSAAIVKPTGAGRTVMVGRGSNGDQLPLVIQAEGTRPHVYVAFRPGDSDFPLQTAFPIFIANALDFLGGGATADLAVQPGAPFSLPASNAATLVGPDGEKRVLTPYQGSLAVPGLDRVGKYTLDVDGRTTTIYASVRDDSISRIAPVQELSLGTKQVSGADQPVRARDLWRFGILGALLLLSGEWWLFARRS